MKKMNCCSCILYKEHGCQKWEDIGLHRLSEIIKQDNNLQKFAAITIKDTGTGIDSEMLPRLFEKFASKSCKGTGLGLFICKSIVEAHGGRIWGENNADGNGATFTFSLPIAEQITSS